MVKIELHNTSGWVKEAEYILTPEYVTVLDHNVRAMVVHIGRHRTDVAGHHLWIKFMTTAACQGFMDAWKSLAPHTVFTDQ